MGEPFTITVTGLRTADLPKTRQIIGNGKLQANFLKRNISDASIIQIDNKDRYCLFYALELMRTFASGELTWMQFSRYKYNIEQQKKNVLSLLNKCNISKNLLSYDAKEWCPIVQEYYNQIYGKGSYKIFIFKDYGFKPIYTSDVSDFMYPILLYHHNNHFDGIRTISKFFNKHHYCLSCESPYSNHDVHRASCKSRCINCSSTGPKYPCKPYPNYKRKCNSCNKTFLNRSCFELHIQKNYCNKSRKCTNPKCGVIWNVSRNTRNGRSGHVCGEKYCFKCGGYHKEEGACFIQKYKPKPAKPYRIIAYDFEAQQIPLNDEKPRMIHKVNFVCAKVICTECIEKDIWRHPLEQPCHICGPFRTLTWAPINFRHTPVDNHIITDDPLREFTSWIIREPNDKYETYAFAHYGGRYDCTLIFGALIRNRITPSLIRQGNRLYEMKVPGDKIATSTIFRDSFNYVSQKLDSLVKAFELPVEPKMWFPHMYNKEENYNTIIPHLPPK